MVRRLHGFVLAAGLTFGLGWCGDASAEGLAPADGRSGAEGVEAAQLAPAQDAWWENLRALCGQALFAEEGIPQSAANVWSIELVPGERFSYLLRRPGRYFQVDFDLTSPVAPPPAPWGHEPR